MKAPQEGWEQVRGRASVRELALAAWAALVTLAGQEAGPRQAPAPVLVAKRLPSSQSQRLP